MTSPRFARLQEIFADAMAMPEPERGAFVRQACGDDDELLKEVAAMLAVSALPSEDLLPCAAPNQRATAPTVILPRPPARPDRYVVERELGRGGMGRVYLVHDRELPRPLALKVTTADGLDGAKTLARFLAEARIMASLNHPGVVPVHDLGHDQDGQPFFTMRCVAGATARQVFAKVRGAKDGWTLTKAIDVLQKVCDTMAYVHQQGIVHRDLKTDNVMVGEFGEVYVMDWGVAKVLNRNDAETSKDLAVTTSIGDDPLTGQGGVLGTPQFMSPEQAAGRIGDLDARCDVYAVGGMLYELLAGVAPYCDTPAPRTAAAIVIAVNAGPPTMVEHLAPGAPGELVSICRKAMARQPADRYPTMSGLAADLRAFLEQRVVRAYERGAMAELKKWVARNKALAVSIAALVLLSIGSAFVLIAQRDQAQQRGLSRSHVEAAHLAMRSGAWRATLAALDRARAAGQADEVDLRLDAAEAHLGLLEVKAACRELETLEARFDVSARLGRLLLLKGHATPERVGQPNRARELFRRALELELEPADEAFSRGVLAGSSEESLQHFESALRLRPFHVGAFQRRLSLLLSLGRFGEVEEQVRLARLSSPRDPMSSAALLLVRVGEGRFAAARDAIAEVVDLVGEEVRSPLTALVDRAGYVAAIPAERASDSFEDWAPEIIAFWTDPLGDGLPILSPACYSAKEAYETAISVAQSSGVVAKALGISKLAIDPKQSMTMLADASSKHGESGLRLFFCIALVNQTLAPGEVQSDKIRRCMPFFEKGTAESTLLFGVRRLSRHLFLRCAHDLAVHAMDEDARARLLTHAASLQAADLQWQEVVLFGKALDKIGGQDVALDLAIKWLRAHPDDDDARAELARRWTLAGAPERGYTIAAEILSRNPNHQGAKESREFSLARWKEFVERAPSAIPTGK